MKARVRAFVCGLLALSGPGAIAAAVDPEPYAWWFPDTRPVGPAAASLVAELRWEIDRILAAGHLAPLYLSFADQESVGYTVYQEPGRIVTTLAWAFPHLDPDRQAAVRAYVAAEFDDPRFAPWGVTDYGRDGNSNYPLPRSIGAPRESHPRDRWWYEHANFGTGRPFLHTLYGVWLWGHRSGEWPAIDAAWPAIRRLYAAYADTDQVRLYGTLGAHLAVVRLAERAGDATTRDTALRRLRGSLETGLDFAAIETFARGRPGQEWRSPYGSYPNMYDPRMTNSTYHGWMFLGLSPEIGRFLHDESPPLREAVLARHSDGKRRFPLWWLPKANYFIRSWTGDEGSGLVPEVMGMLAPVERWVVRADAPTLARQMRGAPNGTGDCHWIEALVQAIEAHGRQVWHDVRQPRNPLEHWRRDHFTTAATNAVAADRADPDQDGWPNLLEYAFGTNPRASEKPAWQPGFQTDDGGRRHFVLTFPRARAAWDAECLVQTSDDGRVWLGEVLQRRRPNDLGAEDREDWVDPRAEQDRTARFYRVVAEAVPWP